MASIHGGDELSDDANPVARPPYAAFQDIVNVEGRGDFSDVFLFALEGEGGSSRDDFEPGCARQVIDDLLREPVGEIFIFLVAARSAKGSTAIEGAMAALGLAAGGSTWQMNR